MNLAESFIRKPIMTTLIWVLVSLAGIAAFFKLPVSDLPVVDSPVIAVTAAYPGASPQTMAASVASPLENQFTQIQGLQSMISTNTEGQTQIILTFELGRNVDLAAPDVQAAINNAAANLPSDLPQPPSYQKTNPSDKPIMYISVISDTLTLGELYDYANKTIGQRLSMIEGVSQVQVWGGKTAVRVQADPNKLAAYKIGIKDIASAVNTGTVFIPGGSLNGPVKTFSIEPKGQLFKAKDYENLIVAYRNNAPVRLKDVARCIDSTENDVLDVRDGFSGGKMRSGVTFISISRSAGSNTVALANRIKGVLGGLKDEIPGSVKLGIFYDKSEQIIESINDVKATILIAIILVVLVIFVFLGSISDTIIPAITLPLTVLATFAVMAALGFTLDNLSLMAIVLAIGFVVDDAIVVLENTVRLTEKGQKPLQAAINSAGEIGFTIVSMTLSLAVIFVPLVFMGGVVGRTFREFAVVVIVTIICSGVIAVFLSPMMCARMLKEKKREPWKIISLFNNFMKGVINGYGSWLRWSLNHKFLMILAWAACLAGTVLFFKVIPKAFLPEGDSGMIQGGMLMSLDTSTKKAGRFQDEIDKILLSDPNIDEALTITGMQPGADQSSGLFFTRLLPKNKRKPMPVVVGELSQKFSRLTGGLVFLQAMPVLRMSTGGEATAAGCKYSYTLSGGDQELVFSASEKLTNKMRLLPGFTGVQSNIRLNLPQLNLAIYRDRASTLGITADDVERALALSFAQGKVTTFKTDIDQYKVIVELDKGYQLRPENLSHIYLRSPTTNGLVPLSAIAKWKEAVGPQNVPHFNQMPAATISFNLLADIPLGTATKSLSDAARQILPQGVTGSFSGEADEFNKAIASLGLLLLVAIFIKYIILGILYESYTHPMTIISTLPVATFGGLLTLLLFRAELSLYGYIGLFMLLGIVAKNGIMMVDFANQNMIEGKNTFDAIYDACLVRFRPILMTGLAAIMGAVPIALGYGADGASRRPLGLIVVGGLVFSQVITLFITPALFLYMQAFQEKYLNKYELFREGAARKEYEKNT